MRAFADTNFIARLYLPQFCHPEAAELMSELKAGGGGGLPITWLLEIELACAWELYVFFGKQPHHPSLTPEQAALAHADFREDAEAGLVYRREELSTAKLAAQTQEIILRRSAKEGCRTYDAIHIASAILLNCEEFWTFDRRAAAIAQKEGLKVPAKLKRLMKLLP